MFQIAKTHLEDMLAACHFTPGCSSRSLTFICFTSLEHVNSCSRTYLNREVFEHRIGSPILNGQSWAQKYPNIDSGRLVFSPVTCSIARREALAPPASDWSRLIFRSKRAASACSCARCSGGRDFTSKELECSSCTARRRGAKRKAVVLPTR